MSHLALSDYGLVGNHSSSALISYLGSIDWCCLPYLDSPSHFAALLDEGQGGRFQIMPQGDFRSEQNYLQRTLVLETVFETPHGRGMLIDWMPMEETGGASRAPVIRRRVEVIDGRIQWLLHCAPRFRYGTQAATAERFRRGVLFRSESSHDELALLQSEIPLELAPEASSVAARFTLEAGQTAHFTWSWGRPLDEIPFESPRASIEAWHAVAHRCPPEGCIFAGPWHDAVARSSLLLQVLQSPALGSIAQAVTTSLPGRGEHGRTWDYRYAWIRDSAIAMQALASLGASQQARKLFGWLTDLLRRDGPEGLQPVYRLDGGRFLPESEVVALEGYRHLGPVRVGNNSSRHFELDLFGHLMLAAAQYHALFGELPEGVWPRLAEIADYLCQVWRRPDRGPWSTRTKSEHFVASKAYCWAALDRACALAPRMGWSVPARWREERDILHRMICTQGYDSERRSFIRAFGDREIDASVLDIPWLGLLPFDDPRVQSTLHAVEEELLDGVLLHRYRAADGLPGTDGTYLGATSKWLTCLALSGRVDEAGDTLAEICSFASPTGMFSEQVTPGTGEMSGNLPCASSHLGLIHAALYVGAARGRALPAGALIGMPAAVLPSPLSRTA
ncbi:MAG: glycoside hydrolase family 15 protein [Oligoflexia bacterium]|nr:glycoside hydrolase family 15 protein [Oligoflexia bacterium]